MKWKINNHPFFTSCLIIIGTLFIFSNYTIGQTIQNAVHLKRGKLWETFTKSQLGGQWNAYNWLDYAMEWPGFDPELPGSPPGGHPSHHAGSGFLIGALKTNGKIEGVADFATSPISGGPGDMYVSIENQKVYPNGENYWLQTNPDDGQEVVKTIWQYNSNYAYDVNDTNKYHMPIRVERTARQWNSDEEDQNYIIINYKITNIGSDSLINTYMMFGYTFMVNRRSWNLMGFQNIYGYGTNDTYLTYDSSKRLVIGHDGVNLLSNAQGNDEFDFWPQGGPNGKGEWSAPGYVGLKFLYISPNKFGQVNKVDTVGWGYVPRGSGVWLPWAVDINRQYQLISGNIAAGDNPATPQSWGRERMVTMVCLGPWDLAPGDSINVSTAEMVDGISYKAALDPNTTKAFVATGMDSLLALADKAQFNFDHHYNIPDPPAAPDSFSVSAYSQGTGNVLTWSSKNEKIPDPDYTGSEAYDLAGYHIYRSEYTDIGPWNLVADIKKGDPKYFDATSGIYKYVDQKVQVGFGYFYSITAYDKGHSTWPPDPSAFPNGVPSLETSKYVNKMNVPFHTQQGPGQNINDVLVVPNPFIIQSGYTIPRDVDKIKFIGVPGVCTIKIYTMSGDLVKTIEHTDGTGVAEWDQVTDSQQFVASGVYIYYVVSKSGNSNGQTKIGKLVIIR